MAKKRRTIYDNDGTVVEETIGVQDSTSVAMRSAPSAETAGKELNIADLVDSFVGYMLPRLEVEDETTVSDDEEETKCMICGAATNKRIRKICFECMMAYRNDLYKKMKSAILNGEKTIRF